MSRRKRALVGLLASVVVLAIGGWGALLAVRSSARSGLEAHLETWAEDRDRFVEGLETERSVVLGEPLDGNAVDLYLTLDEAFPGYEEVRQLDLDDPEGPEEARTVDRVLARDGPTLAEHLGRAVRRRAVDWSTRDALDEAGGAHRPDIGLVISAAKLLAERARRTDDPQEALRLGLLLVAVGRDLLRDGRLLVGMAGHPIERIGCVSLLRTISRLPVPAPLAHRTADRLLALEAENCMALADVARLEGLLVQRGMLDAATGPEITPLEDALVGELSWSTWLLDHLAPSVVYARELAYHRELAERTSQALEKPWPEARERLVAIAREVEEARGHPLADQVFEPFRAPGRSLLEGRLAIRATATLLTATAVRRETGTWPTDATELARVWGRELPDDPLADQPLLYYLDRDAGRVGSWTAGAAAPGEDRGSSFQRASGGGVIGYVLFLEPGSLEPRLPPDPSVAEPPPGSGPQGGSRPPR